MALEDSLTSITSMLSALDQRLTDHTDQDETNFTRLIDQVKVLDNKIDQLLIREAGREGEFRGFRRSAIVIAGAVSLIISVGGVAVAAFL